MSISKEKTGVLINMDKGLKKELQEQAKKEGRTLTNYINYILEQYTKKNS